MPVEDPVPQSGWQNNVFKLANPLSTDLQQTIALATRPTHVSITRANTSTRDHFLHPALSRDCDRCFLLRFPGGAGLSPFKLTPEAVLGVYCRPRLHLHVLRLAR